MAMPPKRKLEQSLFGSEIMFIASDCLDVGFMDVIDRGLAPYIMDQVGLVWN